MVDTPLSNNLSELSDSLYTFKSKGLDELSNAHDEYKANNQKYNMTNVDDDVANELVDTVSDTVELLEVVSDNLIDLRKTLRLDPEGVTDGVLGLADTLDKYISTNITVLLNVIDVIANENKMISAWWLENAIELMDTESDQLLIRLEDESEQARFYG